tara:strand:- start:49 stop:417 length:369 start_codon:yes stop_codon:yes gene_type:complete
VATKDDVLARRQRLYRRQIEGLPARQLVLDHAFRESVSERTAWDDWEVVRKWNDEDWSIERESTISRIQTIRFRAIDKAMRKGQLQTVAQLLADLGKVVGESVETINVQAPELSIKVEKKKS